MKIIDELDAYNFWKWTDKKLSFKEFKELLLNNGHVIISIESEGTYEPRCQTS